MKYDRYNTQPMSELIGKTFVAVKSDDESVRFYLTEGKEPQGYVLLHEQACCEDVYIESIVGDLEDLVDTPILDASAESNEDMPPAKPIDEYSGYTWTFYNLRTIKSSVQIRFFGSSNGYYSETASLHKFPAPERK